MATAVDLEAGAISLNDAALFMFDARFVLGDVEVSGEHHRIRLRTATLPARGVLEAIFSAWTNADRIAPTDPPETAHGSVPSEAMWAQRTVPSESVWAQRTVPSESVWAQRSVPSEAMWAQRAVPHEHNAQPASAAEFDAMFAALAFADPAETKWTPVTIVGRLSDGRRCAIAIDRASRLSFAARDALRIEADASSPRLRVAAG